MSAASLASRMRPGFPKESVTDAAYRTEIEYVGLAADLRSESPTTYSTWGTYYGIVVDSRLEPLEGTDWGILTVVVELKFEPGEATFGEKQESTAEIDWTITERPLREHPEFNVNGTGAHKLTEEDVIALERWEKTNRADYKKEYMYYIDETESETRTLSANAKLIAYAMMMGIESYEDALPVARLTESYAGGPSPDSQAGLKETPSGIPNLPEGYEWKRNADRCVKKGGSGRWERSIEWIGVDKVLVDAQNIYWTVPE